MPSTIFFVSSVTANGRISQHQSRVACQVPCYPVLDFGQDTESARLFDGVFHSIKPGWKHDRYLAGQPVTAYAARLDATG